MDLIALLPGQDLSQDQRNRISILHVKYRFPEEPGSKLLHGNPRSFPVMLDPVLKIDMSECESDQKVLDS
jgi:hypothetical protein